MQLVRKTVTLSTVDMSTLMMMMMIRCCETYFRLQCM